ncbi:MAG: tetratricopeptide repeat protein [Xanthobacteraceae bacterium]|uniref:tetratricopeptide repeat protein n=1 Tax=Pseudolabrys sp. TaxID=1960880 RepID=UPI003D14EA22
MLFRFPLSSRAGAVAVALAAALWAAPVLAETGGFVEPPAKLPKAQKGDPTKNLDFLFEALKIAPDDTTAKAIEQRIWALWFVSRSDTADLLMARARQAYEGKDIDLALKLLDAIVVIKPDYVEAWNRRATIYFLQKDYGKSLADISQVLRLEPRHFGALSGLGMILEEFGDDKHALEAYRRAVEVYPRMERIPDQIKKLQEKVEGRDI